MKLREGVYETQNTDPLAKPGSNDASNSPNRLDRAKKSADTWTQTDRRTHASVFIYKDL